MSRLTNKECGYFDSPEVKNFDAFDVCDFNSELYDKLKKYEDLMEELDCEDIEELRHIANGNKLTIEDNGETILCGDGYCINYDVARIVKENTEIKKKLEDYECAELYLELLLTRLQWIHKQADECREEKERFGGIENMALDSVWRVFDLQKHECCNYEEMSELDEGIRYIAKDILLRTIEHSLSFKATRTENEIISDIQRLKELRGE